MNNGETKKKTIGCGEAPRTYNYIMITVYRVNVGRGRGWTLRAPPCSENQPHVGESWRLDTLQKEEAAHSSTPV